MTPICRKICRFMNSYADMTFLASEGKRRYDVV
nr:MAG TPA: hypothetical protein [Caudoviricetes sp.]